MQMFYFVAQYTGLAWEFFAFKTLSCFTVRAALFSHFRPQGQCDSHFPWSSHALCCRPPHPEHTARTVHIMTPHVARWLYVCCPPHGAHYFVKNQTVPQLKKTSERPATCPCPQPVLFTPHSSYISEFQINIAITSTPRSSGWIPSFKYSPQTLYICSLFPHSCYMLLPTHSRSLCSYIFALLVLCSTMLHESHLYPCGVVLPIYVLITSCRCTHYSHVLVPPFGLLSPLIKLILMLWPSSRLGVLLMTSSCSWLSGQQVNKQQI